MRAAGDRPRVQDDRFLHAAGHGRAETGPAEALLLSSHFVEDQARAAIDVNLRILAAGIDVLRGVAPSVYGRRENPSGRASVGEHVRHCLDFYEALLRDLPSRRIDYVRRTRDPRVESDRDLALARLARAEHGLRRLAPELLAMPLEVRAEDCGVDAASPHAWSGSTLHREMQALASHTVHHFALIALILRAQGVETPSSFGVAPSTLLHAAAEAR